MGAQARHNCQNLARHNCSHFHDSIVLRARVAAMSGGGALWGKYDEAAASKSFQDAVMEWRVERRKSLAAEGYSQESSTTTQVNPTPTAPPKAEGEPFEVGEKV